MVADKKLAWGGGQEGSGSRAGFHGLDRLLVSQATQREAQRKAVWVRLLASRTFFSETGPARRPGPQREKGLWRLVWPKHLLTTNMAAPLLSSLWAARRCNFLQVGWTFSWAVQGSGSPVVPSRFPERKSGSDWAWAALSILQLKGLHSEAGLSKDKHG